MIFRGKNSKNFGWLKKKLDSEDYENYLNQRVAEFKEEAEDLEFANSSLEEADQITKELERILEQKIDDLKLAKIDGLTGLKIRSYFFSEAIPKELSKIFKSDVKEISSESWLTLLKDEKNDLEKIELTIAMSDLSYLSIANRDGHAAGG